MSMASEANWIVKLGEKCTEWNIWTSEPLTHAPINEFNVFVQAVKWFLDSNI